MTKEEMKSVIETLIMRAGHAKDADDALKFSQAAANVANAMAQSQNVGSGSK